MLLRYSRYAVPHALLVDVAETMGRYGRLRLLNHPAHGLVLESTDRPVLEEVLRSKKVAARWSARASTTDTVVVHPSERGHLKQVLLKLGWPAEDLAGYVDGEHHPIELRRGRLVAAARTSGTRPTGSGPAGPASSCCRAGRARPSWAPRPWPGRRPPR